MTSLISLLEIAIFPKLFEINDSTVIKLEEKNVMSFVMRSNSIKIIKGYVS